MDVETVLRQERKEILRVAEKHGASNVHIFGSVARDQADEQSDVDLLVTMEPGRSLLDHAALWLETQELLDHRVDVVSERGLKPRIREWVLQEAGPL
jgi:predicted nucleotidyltransferase